MKFISSENFKNMNKNARKSGEKCKKILKIEEIKKNVS
jgi:hypothetical protein